MCLPQNLPRWGGSHERDPGILLNFLTPSQIAGLPRGCEGWSLLGILGGHHHHQAISPESGTGHSLLLSPQWGTVRTGLQVIALPNSSPPKFMELLPGTVWESSKDSGRS